LAQAEGGSVEQKRLMPLARAYYASQREAFAKKKNSRKKKKDILTIHQNSTGGVRKRKISETFEGGKRFSHKKAERRGKGLSLRSRKHESPCEKRKRGEASHKKLRRHGTITFQGETAQKMVSAENIVRGVGFPKKEARNICRRVIH